MINTITKAITYSIFKDGTAIPNEYQKIIDDFIGHKLSKGEKFNTFLDLNGEKFPVKLTIPDNKAKNNQYQLRYTNNELIQNLKKTFSASYNYISEKKEENLLEGFKNKPVETIYNDNIKFIFNKSNNTITAYPELDPEIITDTEKSISSIKPEEIQKYQQLFEELETKTPERKKTYIEKLERGNISKKVKKDAGYKCQFCQALGLNPVGFTKKDSSETYIEAHHVTPVSTQTKGSLHPRNLICVCANHHRQIHYGNVELIHSDNESFTFKIENKTIKIKRLLNWKID